MSLRHVLVGTALLTVLTLLGCNGHCCRPTGQCNSAGRTCPASPPDSFIPPGSLTTPAVVTPPPPPGWDAGLQHNCATYRRLIRPTPLSRFAGFSHTSVPACTAKSTAAHRSNQSLTPIFTCKWAMSAHSSQGMLDYLQEERRTCHEFTPYLFRPNLDRHPVCLGLLLHAVLAAVLAAVLPAVLWHAVLPAVLWRVVLRQRLLRHGYRSLMMCEPLGLSGATAGVKPAARRMPAVLATGDRRWFALP